MLKLMSRTTTATTIMARVTIQQPSTLEYMSIHREVSVDRLEDLIASGSVMLPSVQTAFMGLRRLRTMGLL